MFYGSSINFGDEDYTMFLLKQAKLNDVMSAINKPNRLQRNLTDLLFNYKNVQKEHLFKRHYILDFITARYKGE